MTADTLQRAKVVYTGYDGVQREAEQHLWHVREQLMQQAGDAGLCKVLREQETLFEQAVTFNKRFAVGTRVAYWKGPKSGPPSGTAATRSIAQVIGRHTAVVWVTGEKGCIALTHVSPAA